MKLYSLERERLLTGMEKAAAMGFPVRSDIAAAYKVPVMDTSTWKSLSAFVGNGQKLGLFSALGGKGARRAFGGKVHSGLGRLARRATLLPDRTIHQGISQIHCAFFWLS